MAWTPWPPWYVNLCSISQICKLLSPATMAAAGGAQAPRCSPGGRRRGEGPELSLLGRTIAVWKGHGPARGAANTRPDLGESCAPAAATRSRSTHRTTGATTHSPRPERDRRRQSSRLPATRRAVALVAEHQEAARRVVEQVLGTRVVLHERNIGWSVPDLRIEYTDRPHGPSRCPVGDVRDQTNGRDSSQRMCAIAWAGVPVPGRG
jgi:hypothetical protein